MLLQNRNPRALQDQHIAARRGEANGAQQHVAPGGKAAADHCFIALCLQRFQRACDRQERSHVIAPAVRAAAVRLGALDGFQLPACAARQHRRPVFAREIGVLRVSVDGKKQVCSRFRFSGKDRLRRFAGFLIARVGDGFQRKKFRIAAQRFEIVVDQHLRAIPQPFSKTAFLSQPSAASESPVPPERQERK